jgi:hypothetical protein
MNTTLGVSVTTNNYKYNQPLFQILKTSNSIGIGSCFYDETTEELKLETTSLLRGKVVVANYSGLELVNEKDHISTKLINHVNDVSFMDHNNLSPNNTDDIIISKGLRTSVTDNEVVFHKPGDTITDNTSPNQVKLPFGMDLTNIGSRLTAVESESYAQVIPDSLNTYSPIVNTY